MQLTWQQNPNPKSVFIDQIMLEDYAPELHIADGFIGGTKRNAMECLFRFDNRLKGKIRDCMSVSLRWVVKSSLSVFIWEWYVKNENGINYGTF